ncbi:hypothetical protein [Bacillus haynesii]|uniref:hypothetical protein n=1 Tax=Bacillus haynesii TaxID=1925021 RepID=UPI00398B495D
MNGTQTMTVYKPIHTLAKKGAEMAVQAARRSDSNRYNRRKRQSQSTGAFT